MQFKDEDGKVLYGFSQENMAELVKEQRRNNLILICLFLILVMGFMLASYILFRIDSEDMLANAIFTLAKGC